MNLQVPPAFEELHDLAEQLCAKVLVNGVLDETNQRDRSVNVLGPVTWLQIQNFFENHDRNGQAT